MQAETTTDNSYGYVANPYGLRVYSDQGFVDRYAELAREAARRVVPLPVVLPAAEPAAPIAPIEPAAVGR